MTITDILTTLAEIEAATARIRAQLTPQAAAPPKPANDVPVLGPDLISSGAAAKIARVTKITITRWAVRHGIGGKIGGRWLVSKSKLEAFILSQAA